MGKHDHIFTWEKPKQCPKGIDLDRYEQLPETLQIRVIRFTIDYKGYRSTTITVATTLLDPEAYPKPEITALYERRWQAEINLRHLKSTMNMDMLRTNSLNYHAALLLLSGKGYATAFAPDQLHELVMLFLDMHSHGYDIGLLFFGLSSIILGYLVTKSGYFPKILGYGLIAAAIVYLAGSFTRFLFPDYVSLISPVYMVPLIAELSFCLWLLIKGVRVRP